MFVFRNNTVERFFPEGYIFSGYGDVSVIPTSQDGYVWWYQLPLDCTSSGAADLVASYAESLRFVLQRLEPNARLIAVTLAPVPFVQAVEGDFSISEAVATYNTMLFGIAGEDTRVRVVDLAGFTLQYPGVELVDWKFWFLSRTALNPRLAKPFKLWWQARLDAIDSKRRKCLVLDLDGTLWGGILGEDGPEGIAIGGDYPGKCFTLFQERLLELSKCGVILAVNSKNNLQDVAGLWDRNPFMVLRQEHFAAVRINWQDKVTNMRELASELNIGLDSMVFLDDNPRERELVKTALPEVAVPEFPAQPYDLPAFLDSLVQSYFAVYSLTGEDLAKTEQYKANAARKREISRFSDFGEYLSSLQMVLTMQEADTFTVPRIAQLTQKTNQFNLTTRRYSEQDVANMVSQGAEVYCLGVADRFGDSGITGCCIIRDGAIDTFLLSCRVLGRGIEIAFLRAVLSHTRLSRLEAQYIPTAKNSQVADFYDRCGWTCLSDSSEGKRYALDIRDADLSIDDCYSIIWKSK